MIYLEGEVIELVTASDFIPALRRGEALLVSNTHRTNILVIEDSKGYRVEAAYSFPYTGKFSGLAGKVFRFVLTRESFEPSVKVASCWLVYMATHDDKRRVIARITTEQKNAVFSALPS